MDHFVAGPPHIDINDDKSRLIEFLLFVCLWIFGMFVVKCRKQ